ncbi:MAG: heavy metal translocating P-type ATPase [Brevinematia bacterium]
MRYVLKNLDCPSCAVRIEEKLRSKGIKDARVDFSTSYLLTQEEDTRKIEQIVREVDSEIVVIPESNKTKDKEKVDLQNVILTFLPFILTIIYRIVQDKLHSLPMLGYLVVIGILCVGGGRIFYQAYRRVISGNFFNEYTMITVATISAILLNEVFEGLLLITLFNIGLFLEDLAVRKSRERIISGVTEIFGRARIKLYGNEIKEVDVKDLNIGDIVVARPGERIPVDGEIVKGSAFIDKSSITGESTPENVTVGDKVTAGSINLDGLLEIKVLSPFEDTILYKIIEEIQGSGNTTKAERFITRLAKVYTPLVMSFAFIVSVVPPVALGTYNFSEWIYKGLIILAVSCPCAIVISVPLTYFKSVGVLASKGIVVKNTVAVDKFSEIKVMFFDKTGTVTKSKLSVERIVPVKGVTNEEILEVPLAMGRFSSHRLLKSILHFSNYGELSVEVSDVREIAGYGVVGRLNGEDVLVGNDKLLHEKDIKHEVCVNDSTVVHIAKGGRYLGFISFSDEEREEAEEVIKELRRLGLKKIFILTGDNEKNAMKIGKSINADDVFFGKSPEEKAKIIEEFGKEYRGYVGFVGDGINDSMAMLKADLGISFNTPLNSLLHSASDVVINSSSLRKILEAIVISRTTKRLVIQNILLALGIKLTVVVLGMFGMMWLWMAVLADSGSILLTIANTVLRSFSKNSHH